MLCCQFKGSWFHSYQKLPNMQWSRSDTIVFADTIFHYHLPSVQACETLELMVQYDENYPYCNLVVCLDWQCGNELASRELSFQLFDNEGRACGKQQVSTFIVSEAIRLDQLSSQFPILSSSSDVSEGLPFQLRLSHSMSEPTLSGLHRVGVRLY